MAKFLVTGGAGFIGSALVRELLQRGERVRVLDNFLTGYRWILAEVSDRIKLLEADITDLEQLRPAFEGTDYVLHHAAIPAVPHSIQDLPLHILACCPCASPPCCAECPRLSMATASNLVTSRL